VSVYINRAELFNRLSTVRDLSEAFAVIQGMPDADVVERKRGRWDKHSSGVYVWHYCSECGGQLILHNLPKYCPNCGAKMEES